MKLKMFFFNDHIFWNSVNKLSVCDLPGSQTVFRPSVLIRLALNGQSAQKSKGHKKSNAPSHGFWGNRLFGDRFLRGGTIMDFFCQDLPHGAIQLNYLNISSENLMGSTDERLSCDIPSWVRVIFECLLLRHIQAGIVWSFVFFRISCSSYFLDGSSQKKKHVLPFYPSDSGHGSSYVKKTSEKSYCSQSSSMTSED